MPPRSVLRSRLPTVILVAGPAGAGKTTVGRVLADRLGAAFLDADDLHSAGAVAKMQRGEGLTDADRQPWLRRVRQHIDKALANRHPLVIACSALKRAYRERLVRPGEDAALVWLDVPIGTLRRRLAERANHFAGPELLGSQLEAAEVPEAGRVEASGATTEVAAAIIGRLTRG